MLVTTPDETVGTDRENVTEADAHERLADRLAATTTYCWTGCKTVTRRIEGHTKFCIPLVGCPDHDYPRVQLFLYGTGGGNATKGSSQVH